MSFKNFGLFDGPTAGQQHSASRALHRLKLHRHELNVPHASSFGKWSQRGVPHKGWTCTDIEDLGEPDLTCEMCESAEVRYVHVMTHPEWQGELRVGCVCAGRMEENYKLAQEREAEFKRRQQPEVSAALSWLKAADEILAKRELTPKEDEFVRHIRWMAEHDAKPRVRKRFVFTAKQMGWFKKIYLRVVEVSR